MKPSGRCPACGAPVGLVRVAIPDHGFQDMLVDGPWPMIKVSPGPYRIGAPEGRVIEVFSPHQVSCPGPQSAGDE